MASLYTDSNGRWIIQFPGNDGRRRSIRLGKVSKKQAQAVKVKVEDLAHAAFTGHVPSDETSRWLVSLDQALHAKLAAVGLAKAREKTQLQHLGPFVADYIASRRDVKERTRINLLQAEKNLLQCFKATMPLASFTPGDADKYRLHLLGRGLAENTVRGLCNKARQFFHAAIRQRLITSNPFSDVKCSVGPNPERQRYITIDQTIRLLDACPDAQWRLIVALSRFAGLRCPSEHRRLRWADINWERERMHLPSPKTEHHAGKASRSVPLFPELVPHLRDAYDLAKPGAVYVVERVRDPGVNLRTQFIRIIRRAGLEPWPRPFHNLRASCQTDLAQRFPLHVACEWIGNAQAVAARHYLQVTEEHYAQAVQNPVQQAAAKRCTELQGEPEGQSEGAAVHRLAEACISVQSKPIPPRGVEPLYAD